MAALEPPSELAPDRVGPNSSVRPLPLSAAYVRRMLAHVVLPCADLQQSSSFYEAVLAPLGISKVFDKPEDVGFGAPGRPDFWLERLLDGQQMRELHLAFRASSRSAVDQFFSTAVAVGAQVLHEPREWPQYDYYDEPIYYAAFVRDPDGNNVEAVCHVSA